jgi:hypothetical protein
VTSARFAQLLVFGAHAVTGRRTWWSRPW